MGFNDVFTAEHYGILLQKANWGNALEQFSEDIEGVHNWGLVAAHLTLLVLLSKAPVRTTRWFLLVQPLVFFWGWFGFWVLPLEIFDLLWGHTSDRESFVDIPYIAIMSQGAWFLACGFIFWKLRPQRLVAGASSHSTAATMALMTASTETINTGVPSRVKSAIQSAPRSSLLFIAALLAVPILLSLFYGGLIGSSTLAHLELPDGSEYKVTQRYNWSMEPYTVSFFMRSNGGNWGWFYIDHEADRWRNVNITYDASTDIILVTKSGTPCARLDRKRKTYWMDNGSASWEADVPQW